MRTTLSIDDDVLNAVREQARHEGRTAGEVLSALARRALSSPRHPSNEAPDEEFLGFRPLPRRGVVVTNNLVDDLRDELGE